MTTNFERICNECGDSFLFTDAEREFRESRSMEEPSVCFDCRGRDRARRNGDLIALYQRTDSFDPFLLGENTQAGSAPPPPTRGRSHPTRSMHPAVCAACGNETTVPFVPRGDRPVYCKACFNERRGR